MHFGMLPKHLRVVAVPSRFAVMQRFICSIYPMLVRSVILFHDLIYIPAQSFFSCRWDLCVSLWTEATIIAPRAFQPGSFCQSHSFKLAAPFSVATVSFASCHASPGGWKAVRTVRWSWKAGGHCPLVGGLWGSEAHAEAYLLALSLLGTPSTVLDACHPGQSKAGFRLMGSI